ncbi:MAG: MFS transporter [Bacillus sp. (in: Bacteria)]|nr:MFS transporter [Bacillus sp. (in: firmicutes)]
MKWHEYPQNIKVRLITSFLNRTVSSSVMPFMALFFAQEKGKIWAGSFLIVTVFISFIVNLIGGYISDRFPRKKVLLITSSLSAMTFLLMTLSLLPSDRLIGLFAVSYIIFIVVSRLGSPAMEAIIIDSTTPENRKSVYVIDYWLVNLSLAIGTALGGMFYVNHQIELFAVLTFTSSCLPVAYWLWLQDVSVKQLKKQHNNVILDVLSNYKVAIKDAPFVKVVVGSMFIFAAEFSMSSYIGVRLANEFEPIDFGSFTVDGVRMLSILNIENTLLVVFLTFFINRMVNHFSKQKGLLVGLLLYGIGYVTVTSANIWYLLVLFNFIATVGELIYSPIRKTEQSNMIPDDKRGSYSAFSNVSFSGADLIARSTIIIGAFLVPSMMSVYIGVIIMMGILLMYTGLFAGKPVLQKVSVMNKNTKG